jgi:hypothetical protein
VIIKDKVALWIYPPRPEIQDQIYATRMSRSESMHISMVRILLHGTELPNYSFSLQIILDIAYLFNPYLPFWLRYFLGSVSFFHRLFLL